MSDIYVHIPGVEGDSEDELNKGGIEVESFSWGISMPTSDTRSGAGSGTVADVHVGELNFTKFMDKSSITLQSDSWFGKHYDAVVIKFYRAESEQRVMYLQMTLDNAVISNFSTSSSGDVPVETFSFNPGKIECKYVPTAKETGKATGQPVTFTYSLITKELT